MQMNFGKALRDATQHLFVPLDLQVGMQAALHEHASAAEFYGLANLVVDRLEVENVPFLRCGAFQRAIKGTEGAVLGAVVGVINVAIDDVGDHAFRMQAAAHGRGFHADADQVVGAKQGNCLLFSESHACKDSSERLDQAANSV